MAGKERDYYDYDVYDQSGEFIGEITLPEVKIDSQDMPQELEINGIIYKPQF